MTSNNIYNHSSFNNIILALLCLMVGTLGRQITGSEYVLMGFGGTF